VTGEFGNLGSILNHWTCSSSLDAPVLARREDQPVADSARLSILATLVWGGGEWHTSPHPEPLRRATGHGVGVAVAGLLVVFPDIAFHDARVVQHNARFDLTVM
jgi:hypothetical protein